MTAMEKGATFSTDRAYRYDLWRMWDRKRPVLCVIGCNPSTADEELDDPTIRRCMGFAEQWLYGGLVMLNLYAWRATEPGELKALAHAVRVGPNNLEVIRHWVTRRAVMCAWGTWGDLNGEWTNEVKTLVMRSAADMFALGVTASGQPRHPLYVKGDTIPKQFP